MRRAMPSINTGLRIVKTFEENNETYEVPPTNLTSAQATTALKQIPGLLFESPDFKAFMFAFKSLSLTKVNSKLFRLTVKLASTHFEASQLESFNTLIGQLYAPLQKKNKVATEIKEVKEDERVLSIQDDCSRNVFEVVESKTLFPVFTTSEGFKFPCPAEPINVRANLADSIAPLESPKDDSALLEEKSESDLVQCEDKEDFVQQRTAQEGLALNDYDVPNETAVASPSEPQLISKNDEMPTIPIDTSFSLLFPEEPADEQFSSVLSLFDGASDVPVATARTANQYHWLTHNGEFLCKERSFAFKFTERSTTQTVLTFEKRIDVLTQYDDYVSMLEMLGEALCSPAYSNVICFGVLAGGSGDEFTLFLAANADVEPEFIEKLVNLWDSSQIMKDRLSC